MRLRMFKVDVRVSDKTYCYYVEASRASVACQRAEKIAAKEHLRRGFHHNPAPFTLSHKVKARQFREGGRRRRREVD